MFQAFDVDQWNRKDAYNLFKTYEDPLFNISAYLDATALHAFCKREGFSFHLALLFYSTKTANETLEFKLRNLDSSLVLFDTIHCGSTILHDDHTFSFCYFKLTDSMASFDEQGKQLIRQNLEQKNFDPKHDDVGLIYYSALPWISFTSIKHARKLSLNDSVPKIVFGKYFSEGNRLKLPISVEVNHSLMDGYQVGKFLNDLQDEIDSVR